jgi:hypothetical protein
MYYDEENIPNWCAGLKFSLCDEDVHKADIKEMIKKACEYEASVIVVSVNVEEELVIDWCKKNKFKRGPIMKNWLHDGRKTYLFFKQVTKKDFKKYCEYLF